METVAFCEIEEFPRKVLRKHWPDVPIFEDVRKLKGSDVGAVDVICGGYPCQPFSLAGERRGKEDDRHLWPEFSRLVGELRPAWVIGENVAGHISMGLDDVLSDLEGQGYAARTFVIPACAVDAPHRRDRVWIVANANSQRPQGGARAGNAGGKRSRGIKQPERRSDLQWTAWPPEPGVGRVADGISGRVDRLSALGNAVVPQVVEAIGRMIMDVERRR
jgi:DNA (cytosine-5)-methyltransferase 1